LLDQWHILPSEFLIGAQLDGGQFVRRTFLAAVLATTAAAVPITAPFAQNTPDQLAQATPPDEDRGGPPPWMRGDRGRSMEGWRGTMMRRDPQERCEDRLAWRAAMRAYVGAKLNLTPEQQPLWDKVQSIAQTGEQKERQVCSNLRPREQETMLERLDRMQAFLSTRLEALQAAKPAVQALYQALTPEQRAIFDRPFRL
jgi:hypothetical protein